MAGGTGESEGVNRAALSAMTERHAVMSSPSATSFALSPDFLDPVSGAQSTFRAALHVMSHPGVILSLMDAECGVPPGLSLAMSALLLTLVDGDTPVWLPQGVDDDVRRYLRFHCGCQVVDDPADACFLAVPAGFTAPLLSECDAGVPGHPDQSATLLLEVASLHHGAAVSLSGPGVDHRQQMTVTGLPAGFWPQWARNQQKRPLGVDVLLTCGAYLCGLPRTIAVAY